MDLNDNSRLRGMHATLSPSNYHWLNYDEQKMRARYSTIKAAQRGTRIHDWAHEGIRLGMRQKEDGSTVAKYINDGIRWRMLTDFMIVFSEHAFGEADTLGYHDNILRISDLKTGVIPANMKQLEIYAGLFCLEYGLDPHELEAIVLRIYQNDKIIGGGADPDKIQEIMTKIKERDRWINKFRKEVE